jgi:hypothetical protein
VNVASRAASDLAPGDVSLVAVGALLLGAALQVSSGFYDSSALVIAITAAVCCIAAVLRLSQRYAPRLGDERILVFVLLAGVLGSLATLAISQPAFYIRDAFWPPSPVYYAALGIAACVAVLIVVDPTRAMRVWFPLALGAASILGVWLIRASPHPRIDVLTVYSAALYALREGSSPYSISFTNIYGNSSFYPPGFSSGSEVQFGFPYPPLALLMALPGKAIGDIRYAELAALLVGAALIARSGRGRRARLAAMMLLFTPRSLFVLEQGWSEPFAVCWLGVLMFVAARRLAVGVPLGLLIGVKQHLLLALLFSPSLHRGTSPGTRWRTIGSALAVVGAITLPFVFWDPSGFWKSVAALQFNERLRLDSLSVVAALGQRGWTPSGIVLVAVPAVALAIGLALSWRFAPGTPSGFALSLGLSLLLLFLFSKKAFCNYYYLVIAALAASVAASDQAAAEGECDTDSSNVRYSRS